VQNHRAADAEADDRSQGGNQHQSSVEMNTIGEDGDDREDQSQNIQPEGRANRTVAVFAEPQFQQQGSKSDCRYDNQREWARERCPAGIDDDQRKCQQKQSSSDKPPAARLGFGRRIGARIGQGIVIQAGKRTFKRKNLSIVDS
jgi:hypothetical protein